MKTLNTQTTNPINLYTMKTIRTFESFSQFLINVYSKQNGGKFLSQNNYLSYIRNVIKHLGISESQFLNAELTLLKAWFRQLEDKPSFRKVSAEYRNDLKSGFNAFINYGRYQVGYVTY